MKLVTCFLKAGIPLSKADDLRELFEENGQRLTSSTHLRQILPFILREEMLKIKKEISGKPVSIIFDGTTHVTEAFAVIVRFMDGWNVQQRLCGLKFMAKSLLGEETARLLIEFISTELGISSSLIIAAMHDRASVNAVAMRTISILYNNVFDVGCYSHTIDHVGERMNTPVLHKFLKSWIAMFSHSPKAKLSWRTQTGLPAPTFSNTRWWSKFEVIRQVRDSFGDVVSFLNGDNLPPSSEKLGRILSDASSLRKLKIELAITTDSMEPFVRATYNLEGDGVLALSAYREISQLHNSVRIAHYPNVMAVAREESQGNAAHEQMLVNYAAACVKPAYDYFLSKFDATTGELCKTLAAFKAARYFSPVTMNELRPSPNDLDALSVFPFIDTILLEQLKGELAAYMAAAEDISQGTDVCEWWKRHDGEIPSWAKVCKLILLIQPSSAAVERAFSVLENSFSKRQEHSLEDYVSLSIMLQYNRKH